MPELAEVERSCQLVRQHCEGKKIEVVICKEQGGGPRHGLFDNIVFTEDLKEDSFVKAVTGGILRGVRRKGKQMWFEIEKGTHKNKKLYLYALLHFGMTGSFSVKGVERATYKDFKVDKGWPPRFCKLEIVFNAGNPANKETRLAFTDPRRLGRIRLRLSNPLKQPPLCALGSDPVLDPLPFSEFKQAVSRCGTPIKALLLNQNGPFCGIGNWIADEVLYQAEIHPSAKGTTLSETQVQSLYVKIIYVCKHAVQVNADSSKFPSSWMFHYRWSKRDKTTAKVSGNKIIFETVAGRTSAIVPTIQKMGHLRSREKEMKKRKTKSKPNMKLKSKKVTADSAVPAKNIYKKVKTATASKPTKGQDPNSKYVHEMNPNMRQTRSMAKASKMKSES